MVLTPAAQTKSVCRAAKRYLQSVEHKPIINIAVANPSLYSYTTGGGIGLAAPLAGGIGGGSMGASLRLLPELQRLRLQLGLMKDYVLSCKHRDKLLHQASKLGVDLGPSALGLGPAGSKAKAKAKAKGAPGSARSGGLAHAATWSGAGLYLMEHCELYSMHDLLHLRPLLQLVGKLVHV